MKLAAIAAAAFSALVMVAVVAAHAEPVTVKPGDGAILAAPPAEVVIGMSQDMARQAGANNIEVFDSTGKKVTTIAAVIDNGDRSRLSVSLPPGLPNGTYTVKWKTLSADDGDSANGTLSFTIDPAKSPSAGKENLRETGIGETPQAQQPAASASDDSDSGGGGTSWVLISAVAVAMLAIGSGGTFLFVKKGP